MVSYTTMVAAPVAAWVLYDMAEYYMPTSVWFPVVSYFRRQWKNPENQATHMKIFGDLILFAAVAFSLFEARELSYIRGARNEERAAIEQGLEQTMMSDYQSHGKCMETLVVKHKLGGLM